MFTVWKTVQLGTGLLTLSDFQKALDESGCCRQYSGEPALGKMIAANMNIEIAPQPQKIMLVAVNGLDLGFPLWLAKERKWKKLIYGQTICEEAIRRGLALCSAETGIQLRIQYTDQPPMQRLFIGMKPLSNYNISGSFPKIGGVFVVENDGGLKLDLFQGALGTTFDATERWIFQMPD